MELIEGKPDVQMKESVFLSRKKRRKKRFQKIEFVYFLARKYRIQQGYLRVRYEIFLKIIRSIIGIKISAVLSRDRIFVPHQSFSRLRDRRRYRER